ncbi:MAG: aminoacyl-tRNA deacylase [Christensenellales bacterium]|jgi:Cys-tRNA(Pro)/Cys-tRNA(Cys) deacylase
MIVTNVMRLLTKAKVAFTPLYYDLGDAPFSGEAVCRALGIPESASFKTLCATGERKGVAVFVVPIAADLHLKKAAAALGDKAVALCHVKDLLGLTGYERGSVTPVGMKKRYPVFIDDTALSLSEMAISGGAQGVSLMVKPREIASYLGATFAPLCGEP